MSNTLDLSEEKNWLSLKKDLKQSVGDSAYNNWIKHLSFVSYENNTLSFSLPTKFLRDWIVNNYSDKIKTESKKYLDSVNIIKYFRPFLGNIVPPLINPPDCECSSECVCECDSECKFNTFFL